MIRNAKDRLVPNLNSLPDVSGAIDTMLQPVRIGLVQTSQVNGLSQEVIEWHDTMAVRQPFTSQQLAIRAEGERAWRWYTLHLDNGLPLRPNDVIKIHGLRMRIMEKLDWSEYGYSQYSCVEDFVQDETRTMTP
jgi:hypothetical protein